jgi:hypothetical protein
MKELVSNRSDAGYNLGHQRKDSRILKLMISLNNSSMLKNFFRQTSDQKVRSYEPDSTRLTSDLLAELGTTGVCQRFGFTFVL